MESLPSPETEQEWLDIINIASLDPTLLNKLKDALHNLDDQNILYKLGLRVSDPEIFAYLAPQLSDIAIIQLLEERNNPDIRLILARHLQSFNYRLELFNTKSESDEIRISLITSLLDEQEELASMLITMIPQEQSPRVKAVLISHLSPEEDEEMLTTLVFGEEYVEPRQQAAALIHNQDTLRTLLYKEQNGDVRHAAVKNLTDSSILERLAVEDLYWKVRMAALQKIDTMDILRLAAESDPVEEIRMYCLDHLDDPNLLASIAMNDTNPVLRKRAVELIVDQGDIDTMLVIAQEEKDPEIRILAINHLSNEEILTKIITSSTVNKVQIAAINRLTDVDILIELIRELNNLMIQRAIITRLTALEEIVTLELLEAETQGSIRQQIRAALKSLY